MDAINSVLGMTLHHLRVHVADSLLKMTWNSADRYAALQAGHRYELTTVGFRIPVTSTFPNIIHSRPVGGGV